MTSKAPWLNRSSFYILLCLFQLSFYSYLLCIWHQPWPLLPEFCSSMVGGYIASLKNKWTVTMTFWASSSPSWSISSLKGLNSLSLLNSYLGELPQPTFCLLEGRLSPVSWLILLFSSQTPFRMLYPPCGVLDHCSIVGWSLQSFIKKQHSQMCSLT